MLTPLDLLTPERFRSWLESKPGDAVVGTTDSLDGDLFGAYLAEQGVEKPAIYPYECRDGRRPHLACGPLGQTTIVDLPAWVASVDGCLDNEHDLFGEVTAAEALATLADVLAATGRMQ